MFISYCTLLNNHIFCRLIPFKHTVYICAHNKFCLCIYLASFAQIIKPLNTQYASINGNSNLTSSSSSSPPVNEHEKSGAYSSSPPSHEEGEINDDDEVHVYELEFGKSTNLRPKPVAKPRRRVDRTRHGSAPGLKITENGLESHDQTQESTASVEVRSHDVSHDQHPTPSRSAPAPPNATAEVMSNDRVSEMIVDCAENLTISLSPSLSPSL